MKTERSATMARTVFSYHEVTKHYPSLFAKSIGYMDWANEPVPFRFYDGAERIPLPLIRNEKQLPYASLYWREAWKYGERAFRYCHHDLGHALTALRFSANLLGWKSCLLPRIAEKSLESYMGFDNMRWIKGEKEPWRYPRLFWETGLIGQVLYLEAEAHGLRGTGMGCYLDDPMHDLLGLKGDTYQSLYHFTVGAPKEDPRIQTLAPYHHLSLDS